MMPASIFCHTCGTANQSQASYCRSCGSPLQTAKSTIYNSATGQLLTNTLLKQRYRIIAPIGKGGMGAVYRAEDTRIGNRPVALKEMSQSSLSPQELQEAADAFKREATMLAHLQHPHLPSIFDHFEENGRWYLVMSFIKGETLKDYLNKASNHRLSLDETLQIGIQLCAVLDYLHNQQPAIIFRDLKPANIMRTPDGHIYLVDFGIARLFKPGQAQDTAYYGSLGYAPPEQYGQAQTTPRSDIYSLGVVLYQLLSGHNPSTTPFQFPPVQSRVPNIPPELATLITRMLELDVNKRPADVHTVNKQLQSLLAAPHGLVLPAPTVPASTPPIAPSQQAKRKPGWMLLAGVLAIVIIATGVISLAPSFQMPASNTSTQSSQTTITAQPYTTYPHLTSSYQGFVHNSTGGISATLTLTSLVQNQQLISGRATIGPGLIGSGLFTGSVDISNSINFTVTADDGSGAIIHFTGSVTPQNTLGGAYTTEDGQIGTWQANPNNAHAGRQERSAASITPLFRPFSLHKLTQTM